MNDNEDRQDLPGQMMMFGIGRESSERRGGAGPSVAKVARRRPRSFSVEFSEDGGATFKDVEIGMSAPDPDGPLVEGCRVVWRDNQGRDWAGVYRFTLGDLASIELDGISGVVACRVRVRPDTLRRIESC
jgi:hypothetical protein